jgi:hypothetical protein
MRVGLLVPAVAAGSVTSPEAAVDASAVLLARERLLVVQVSARALDCREGAEALLCAHDATVQVERGAMAQVRDPRDRLDACARRTLRVAVHVVPNE